MGYKPFLSEELLQGSEAAFLEIFLGFSQVLFQLGELPRITSLVHMCITVPANLGVEVLLIPKNSHH